MSTDEIPSLFLHLELTRVVKILDAFSDAVHAKTPESMFFLGQAHHLSARMRTLEKGIRDWDRRMSLECAQVTFEQREFQELVEETQIIRIAAKGIQDYLNSHLKNIRAEVRSNQKRQRISQDSSLAFRIESGPFCSNGYYSASAPLISSHSSSATSYGSRPDRVNTPSLSDVSSTSVPWSLLDNENGSVKNYRHSEGTCGSVFSCANACASRARARSDTPTPSLGQSSKSSYHTAFSQPFNGK